MMHPQWASLHPVFNSEKSNIKSPQPSLHKMISQVLLLCLVSLASAQYGYAPPYAKPYEQSYYEEKPQPYSFGYDIKDAYGSSQTRREDSDDYGNKKGSYGYTDGYGIYRHVDYVADDKGFRAYIKTNEPGTDNQDPADVGIYAEPAKYDSYAYDSAYSKPAPVYKPAPAYNSYHQQQQHQYMPYHPAPVYDASEPRKYKTAPPKKYYPSY